MLFLVFPYLFRFLNLNLLAIHFFFFWESTHHSFLDIVSSKKIDPINFSTLLYMPKYVYDVYILFPSSKIFGLGKCGVLQVYYFQDWESRSGRETWNPRWSLWGLHRISASQWALLCCLQFWFHHWSEFPEKQIIFHCMVI